MLIDDFLPMYDVAERHAIDVSAPVEPVYAATRKLDLSSSILARFLFWLRKVPGWLFFRRSGQKQLGLNMEGLLKSGFILLGEKPHEEIVLGLVGRFWTAQGDLQSLDSDGFQRFQERGYAKAASNFSLSCPAQGVTRLTTETRVLCLDAHSRRRFRLYWLFVRPFSGMVRKEALRAVKREAERIALTT